ncbi:hypothetical protein ACFOY4_04915 [Actinomadura syzygii]|uniref:Insecticidal crystal toxin domain-containing protein n=1 Tax=Actinomadura syzygii TaxID=1427538 RepID=A0A5D0TV15_9ACTN|nr:hypothetical protein [Actinomadura syzygii]TYC10028.1 hypothetical protein FXF65_33585 [Actinomadura syzygii]
MAVPMIGKTYAFKCKSSGKYFHGPKFDNEDRVEFALYQTSINPVRWMLCEAGNSRTPSQFLGVETWKVDGQETKAVVCLELRYWDKVPEDKKGLIWEIKEDASGSVRLWNNYAGAYLKQGTLISGKPRDDLPGLTEEKRSDGSDLFTAVEKTSFPGVLAIKHPDKTEPSHPKLTSMDKPSDYMPSEKGTLTGITAVPFFVISNDHNKTYDWQAKNSPYYIIEKWTRYHLVGWNTYAAGTSDHYAWSTTEGVTEDESKSISETTSFSVNASAGFSFWGISASISASFAHDLNVTTTHQKSTSYTHTVSEDHTIGQLIYDEAMATWYFQHHYVIYRADHETDIIDFTVTVPDQKTTSTFQDKN